MAFTIFLAVMICVGSATVAWHVTHGNPLEASLTAAAVVVYLWLLSQRIGGSDEDEG